MITVDVFAKQGSIRHGFFTRDGGVSDDLYASLNCGFGSGDDATKVAENRDRVIHQLGVTNTQMVTCYQEHTAKPVVVDVPWSPDDAPVADGMATRTPGVALGILTADCAPVLFADEDACVIGAAHAGWQGALHGIMEATIESMIGLGAARDAIKAAIGPCIAQQSYEVGPEFYARFVEDDPATADFFAASTKTGHHMFDLASYCHSRLTQAGIVQIGQTGYDTCRDENLFYSYRRSVLHGEPDYGREISAIVIAP